MDLLRRLPALLLAPGLFAGIAAASPSTWLRLYDPVAPFLARPGGGFLAGYTEGTDPDNVHAVIVEFDENGDPIGSSGCEWGSGETVYLTALDPRSGAATYHFGWGISNVGAIVHTSRGAFRYDGYDYYLAPWQILEAPGGGAVVAGTARNESWVIGIDTDGTILWQRSSALTSTSDSLRIWRAEPAGTFIAQSQGDGAGRVTRIDESGQPVWGRRISAPGRRLFLGMLSGTRDGGVLVAGTLTPDLATPDGIGFVLKLDGAGALSWLRLLRNAAEQASFWSATELLDGGVLVNGQSEGRRLVLRFDASMALLWQRHYPDFKWFSVFEGGLGGLFASGYLGADGFFARLDPDGTPGDCAAYADADLVDAASAITVEPELTVSGPPVAVPAGSGLCWASGQSQPRTICADDCLLPPGPVALLKAARNGGDASFAWEREPNANAYDLWWVAIKQDIDRARMNSTPPAGSVAGCTPSATRTPACIEQDAVSAAPALRYYQVRAWCAPGREGP